MISTFRYPVKSCYQTTESSSLKTSKDYTESIGKEVGVSASGGMDGVAVKCGVSVGHNAFKEDVESKRSQRLEYLSYCLQYVAGFVTGKSVTYTVTKEFSDAVSTLPLITDTTAAIDDSTRSIWQ